MNGHAGDPTFSWPATVCSFVQANQQLAPGSTNGRLKRKVVEQHQHEEQGELGTVKEDENSPPSRLASPSSRRGRSITANGQREAHRAARPASGVREGRRFSTAGQPRQQVVAERIARPSATPTVTEKAGPRLATQRCPMRHGLVSTSAGSAGTVLMTSSSHSCAVAVRPRMLLDLRLVCGPSSAGPGVVRRGLGTPQSRLATPWAPGPRPVDERHPISPTGRRLHSCA
jgi:hypothetical protein